jgi:hypothetical protein
VYQAKHTCRTALSSYIGGSTWVCVCAASVRRSGFYSGGSSQYWSVGIITAVGVEGGGFMGGGSLGGCQRSHWEI